MSDYAPSPLPPKRKRYITKPLTHEVLPAGAPNGKQCTWCEAYLSLASFAKSNKHAQGRFYYCRLCCKTAREQRWGKIKVRDQRYYSKTRDQQLQKAIVWHKANPAQRLLQFARARARKLGVPFDLVEADIVIPLECPALGLKLAPNLGVRGRAMPNSPNLDRIEPALGYVRGNVQVISHLANTMKSRYPLEDWHKFARWILTIEAPGLHITS